MEIFRVSQVKIIMMLKAWYSGRHTCIKMGGFVDIFTGKKLSENDYQIQ